MKVSDNGLEIMKARVLWDGEKPEEMLERVAKTIAMGDKDLEEAFFYMMDEGVFLPNSPCLSNAGIDGGQLMACFVLPIEDSMHSIMQTLYDSAMVQKTGGGTGFTFSKLRPSGASVKSTNGVASGPVSFLGMYDSAMEVIKQGGRRRAAALATLNVEHDDILEFILCKDDGQLSNFNISVGANDSFMERVHTKDPDALQVWGMITQSAWKTGDPGMLFLDTINKHNPTPELGRIESTNPCGEVPLLPNEACVLGSINLTKCYMNGIFNWIKLNDTVDLAVEFLDNIIDCTAYPTPAIEKETKRTRKIGLGIMGLADLFYLMGVRYGSQESFDLASSIMSAINERAVIRSQQLGWEKGPCPAFIGSASHRRNACVTSIAPTGTIAAILDASFSAEPCFGLVYTKTILDNTKFYEVNPIFRDKLRELGLDTPEILEKVAMNGGSVQGMQEMPPEIKELFVTAHELGWATHIKMQAVLQEHTEQSISKTINFPEHATSEDVADAYMLAWELGCKGVTVYRDGSKIGQPLSTKYQPSERPHVLKGETHKFKTGCGSLYVTINNDALGDPHEVFANHSKRSGCVVAMLNSLARVTSISLRSGVDAQSLADAMQYQDCGECGEGLSSCADALGRVLSTNQVCTIGGGCQTCG